MEYVFCSRPSDSANNLKAAMGIKRIRTVGGRYQGKEDDVVINWGSTELRPWMDKVRVLNHPSVLARYINKLDFFKYYDNTEVKVYLPRWSENIEDAINWLHVGSSIVVRHKLRAAGGAGIELIHPGDGLVPHAPLYTRYIKKSAEFRVHFFGDQIRDIQVKLRNRAVADEDVNWQIRNYKNGFIYARENVDVPGAVMTGVQKFIRTTDLDYGAIDLIFNAKSGSAYILEVNTAPGLEGRTLDIYSEELKKLCHNVG